MTTNGTILDRLVACPRIEYWYDRLVVERAAANWRQTIDHLLARIHEREDDYSYDALPFDGFSGDLLEAHPDQRRMVLTEILTELAHSTAGRGGTEFPVLFWSVAGLGEEPLDVIGDALAGNEQQRGAASSVISGGPRHRFLGAQAWVSQQLEASPPGEPLDELRSALGGALHSGIKQGRPGEPFPEDVELEAAARQHAAASPAGSRTQDFWTRIAASAAREVQRAVSEDNVD